MVDAQIMRATNQGFDLFGSGPSTSHVCTATFVLKDMNYTRGSSEMVLRAGMRPSAAMRRPVEFACSAPRTEQLLSR